MEAQLIILILCTAMLVLNVIIVLDLQALKRARGHRPPDVVDDLQDTDRVPPEHDTVVIARERQRIKRDLRERFPKLTELELNNATHEILTKARQTLSRIP